MTVARAAALTALVSGSLLVVALVASAVAVPGFVGTARPFWPMSMMGQGYGSGMMTRGGPMGPGMMGSGAYSAASAAIPNAPEVRVEASNFAFTPREIHLPKGADVNLTFANSTSVAHDLTVPGLGIHIVANAGETRTIGLRNLPPGRYDAYCTVPGHADLGMRGAVVVD